MYISNVLARNTVLFGIAVAAYSANYSAKGFEITTDRRANYQTEADLTCNWISKNLIMSYIKAAKDHSRMLRKKETAAENFPNVSLIYDEPIAYHYDRTNLLNEKTLRDCVSVKLGIQGLSLDQEAKRLYLIIKENSKRIHSI